jgi:hypothetical protein
VVWSVMPGADERRPASMELTEEGVGGESPLPGFGSCRLGLEFGGSCRGRRG